MLYDDLDALVDCRFTFDEQTFSWQGDSGLSLNLRKAAPTPPVVQNMFQPERISGLCAAG